MLLWGRAGGLPRQEGGGTLGGKGPLGSSMLATAPGAGHHPYQPPVAAVTDDHKFSSLNQHQLAAFQSRRSEARLKSPWWV